LGLGQRASTGLTTFNAFWVYVIPLFGAYMADTRWGRFKTICISTAVALVGHVLLIVSAVPTVIDHPNGALGCFIIAIIIMGLGTGGFKPNISPLVAEQYQRTKLFIRTEPGGARVIVDPSLTAARIYMVCLSFSNVFLYIF
jgi:proton-dependent oligopeptide transporter, POT family